MGKEVIRISIVIESEETKIKVNDIAPTVNEKYETVSMFKGYELDGKNKYKRRIYKNNMHFPISYLKDGDLINLMEDTVICYIDTFKEREKEMVRKAKDYANGLLKDMFDKCSNFMDNYDSLKFDE